MYCPCDGQKLGSRFPYHADDPCKCRTCVDQPNYCADDGAFIGSREYHAMHFETRYRDVVDNPHVAN